MAPERQTSPRRQLAGGALISLVIQIAGIASAAVTSLAVARVTGPDGTARFGLCLALLSAGIVVSGLGLSAGITFLVSRHAWHPRRALATSQGVAAGAGLIGAGSVVLLQQLTHTGALRGVTLAMALIVGAALPFALSFTYASAVALATERYETYGLAQGVQLGVSLLTIVGLVVAVGVIGAVVGVAMSYFAAWLFLNLRLSRQLTAGRRANGDEPPVRRAFAFGLRAWGADMLQLVNYRLDLFVLNAFVSQAVVGRYALAVSLTALGWVLPSALQTVLFPRAAANHSDVEATVAIALRHAIVLLTVSTVVLVGLLPAVPAIYGRDFSATVGYGFLLLPGVIAIGFAKPLSAVITGRGYPQYSLYNALVTAPATVVLYLVLVPLLGGVGAALASTVSYTMSLIIAIYYFRRVTQMRLLTALRSPRAVIDDYVEAAHNLRRYVGMRWPR